ncbi:uncharacterized protein LOC128048431 [Budorcas taxicolor]|uniref:uncharacterized protein LOC128048431 n=1 Tax=Budorcas taxicolor TaxID=37181 RepID=UPI00228373F3|nr:uncharacterized protein LOC128048431 [Budorcas taxicolor]
MGQGLCSRGCDSAVPAASERDPPARAELPTSAPQARSGSRRHLRMVPSSAVVNPTQGVSLGAAGLLRRTNSVTSLLSLVAFGADPLCACQALGNSTFVCSDRHQLWMNVAEHLRETGRLSWPSEDAPAPRGRSLPRVRLAGQPRRPHPSAWTPRSSADAWSSDGCAPLRSGSVRMLELRAPHPLRPAPPWAGSRSGAEMGVSA